MTVTADVWILTSFTGIRCTLECKRVSKAGSQAGRRCGYLWVPDSNLSTLNTSSPLTAACEGRVRPGSEVCLPAWG